jgi:hypothetical protein
MKKIAIVGLMMCIVFTFMLPLFSAADDANISVVTKDKAKTAIRDYINHEIKVKGKFYLPDHVENKILALDFDHVHSGVAKVHGGYLVCVDFRSGANLYDVDFIVKEEAGEFQVNNAVVHSVNGVERARYLDTILGKEGATAEEKGSGYEDKGSGHEHMGSEYEHKGSH